MKSILPHGSAEHNYVFHRHKNLKKYSSFHLILLIAVMVSLIALPWIQIDTVTTAPGLIAPPGEPFQIRARSSGTLLFFDHGENRFAKQGDTLFSIRRTRINSEEFYRAPIDGLVRRMKPETAEALVQVGEVIIEIQPETNLSVKCFLPGDKITSIQPEQRVEFQIQAIPKKAIKAFSGKVTKILPSEKSADKAAIFEVRCSIDDTLPNEPLVSHLKPGMTLLTRFRSARRSAFDILLKDIEESDRNPT